MLPPISSAPQARNDAGNSSAQVGTGSPADAPPGAIPDEHPLIIEHLQKDLTPSGAFTPDAQIVVSRSFRTSGLLANLPDSEARSLLAVLTLLTANGRLSVTAAQIATALGIPEKEAQARLERLCQILWRGKPVAVEHVAESHLKTVGLSPHVITSREPLAVQASSSPPSALPVTAGREAIITHSRSSYGRPRAEVEREIEAQFRGRGGSDSSDGGDMSTPEGRLAALGLSPDEVNALVSTHTDQEIADQLDWLPYRGAKNPARFVVAAIQGRYEPPARIRLERALAAEETPIDSTDEEQSPAVLPVGDTVDLEIPLDDPDDVAEPSDA